MGQTIACEINTCLPHLQARTEPSLRERPNKSRESQDEWQLAVFVHGEPYGLAQSKLVEPHDKSTFSAFPFEMGA